MSLILFSYRNYTRVSHKQLIVDRLDLIRHEWSKMEIFVQCLSLLWKNLRPYRTHWTWRSIWGQRQRTLPEPWVILNWPLTFLSYSLGVDFCHTVLLPAIMCPDALIIILLILSSDGGRAKAAEETESDLDAELLTQSSSAGSPQSGQHTHPGTGESEAGAPEPGPCTQLMHTLL